MYLPRAITAAVKTGLGRCGYELAPLAESQTAVIVDPARVEYGARRKSILDAHDRQTAETVRHLNSKYREPVFGEMRVWDLFQRLAFCVDPTDTGLLNTTQYGHVLQVLEAMEKDHVEDSRWYIAAILHDLGKLLLLTPEAPENVVCLNSPVGYSEEGIGLDNVVMQWNHDEFAYRRLKDYVPEEIAWLIRYHSIKLADCEAYMDERDRAYRDDYLIAFRKYDFGSKSPCRYPSLDMDKYRTMIEEAFPDPIPF